MKISKKIFPASRFQPPDSSLQSGFSLVEILATMAVFFIISSVLFFNFRTFGSRTVLDNLAYQIALTVRQAQVYGISVRGEGGGFPSYGAFFNILDNKVITLFADTYPSGSPAGDGKYTSNDTLIQQFSIPRGDFVSQICGYASSAAPCTFLDKLHITYVRPNPEGKIIGINSVGEVVYAYADVSVSTLQRDFTRKVTIWSNGQISVQ